MAAFAFEGGYFPVSVEPPLKSPQISHTASALFRPIVPASNALYAIALLAVFHAPLTLWIKRSPAGLRNDEERPVPVVGSLLFFHFRLPSKKLLVYTDQERNR